jgi:hypothetical protein
VGRNAESAPKRDFPTLAAHRTAARPGPHRFAIHPQREWMRPVPPRHGEGRRLRYFTGARSAIGQMAANRASSSVPPAFFGVSERQPAGTAKGTEGL